MARLSPPQCESRARLLLRILYPFERFGEHNLRSAHFEAVLSLKLSRIKQKGVEGTRVLWTDIGRYDTFQGARAARRRAIARRELLPTPKPIIINMGGGFILEGGHLG
jgi:hypothetical protein